MGAMLSEPNVEKSSCKAMSRRFAYAASQMQGWRKSMEDAHLCELDLVPESNGDFAFFAVFDGHGGRSVACCASTRLNTVLVADPAFAAGDYTAALRSAFLTLDHTLRTVDEVENQPSGSTCVSALFTPTEIYVANAGDSRAVLSTNGNTLPLSIDHKPCRDCERTRILGSGGFIEYNRVNGNLALTRAFGDYEFKANQCLPPEEQIVTVDPEIMKHSLTPNDEFLILACDGIWDCVSSEQAVMYVRYQVAKRVELVSICEQLMDACLSTDIDTDGTGVGCDNMTVQLVAILGDRTEAQWYDWMAAKYADLASNLCPIAPRRASSDTEPDNSQNPGNASQRGPDGDF